MQDASSSWNQQDQHLTERENVINSVEKEGSGTFLIHDVTEIRFLPNRQDDCQPFKIKQPHAFTNSKLETNPNNDLGIPRSIILLAQFSSCFGWFWASQWSDLFLTKPLGRSGTASCWPWETPWRSWPSRRRPSSASPRPCGSATRPGCNFSPRRDVLGPK